MARRDIIALIMARHGFVEKRSNRHRIWQHPTGAVVTTGSTISDHRALKNIERDCRRALMAV